MISKKSIKFFKIRKRVLLELRMINLRHVPISSPLLKLLIRLAIIRDDKRKNKVVPIPPPTKPPSTTLHNPAAEQLNASKTLVTPFTSNQEPLLNLVSRFFQYAQNRNFLRVKTSRLALSSYRSGEGQVERQAGPDELDELLSAEPQEEVPAAAADFGAGRGVILGRGRSHCLL